MTLVQAILIGLVYYMGSSCWLNGYLTVTRPFIAATLVGFIMGSPVQGAIIGANIQMIYMGWMSVGGSQPTDACLAGTLSTAFALASGLETSVALTMSVPLGILGGIVWIGRNTLNVFVMHLADKPAADGEWRKFFALNTLAPQPVLLLITAVPVTLAAYFGTDAISGVIDFIGNNVLGILATIGGVLPAVGIALNLRIIMKTRVVPYFFLGFFLAAYFGLSLVAIAAISVCAAALYFLSHNESAVKEA